MAARDQRNARNERVGRVDRGVPAVEAGSTSRVSKAAGGVGSEKVSVEQRTGAPSSPVKQRASAKAGSNKNGASSSRSQRSKPGGKKAEPGRASARPSPAGGSASPQPADSRLSQRRSASTCSMPPRHSSSRPRCLPLRPPRSAPRSRSSKQSRSA